MKKIICTLIAGLGSCALAQTNVAAVKPPPAPTQINSDAAEFDLAKHHAVYHGHVRVDDPKVKLTCAWMLMDLPESGGHISHALAETNVVINFLNDKGETNHATADKAVYSYNVQGVVTNELITLTGSPKVESADGILTGDVIIWDRANNHVSVPVNPVIRSKPGAATTNGAAPKLF
jgi:lipopolysaccharide transport protein LptA